MTKAKLPISISCLTIIGMVSIMYTSAPAHADCGFTYENDVKVGCPLTDYHGEDFWVKNSEGKYEANQDRFLLPFDQLSEERKKDRLWECQTPILDEEGKANIEEATDQCMNRYGGYRRR